MFYISRKHRKIWVILMKIFFGPEYNDYRNEFATSDLSCVEMLLLTQNWQSISHRV